MKRAMLVTAVLALMIVGVFAPMVNVQAADSAATSAPSGEGASLIGAPTQLPEPTPNTGPKDPHTLGTAVWDGVSKVYVNNTYGSFQDVEVLINDHTKVEYYSANKTFMVHVIVIWYKSAITLDNSSVIFDTAAYSDLNVNMWFGQDPYQAAASYFNCSNSYFNRCNGSGYYDNYVILGYTRSWAINCYFTRAGMASVSLGICGIRYFHMNYGNVYDHLKGSAWFGFGGEAYSMRFEKCTWLYPRDCGYTRIFNRYQGVTANLYVIEGCRFVFGGGGTYGNLVAYLTGNAGENVGTWYLRNNTVFNGITCMGGLYSAYVGSVQYYGNKLYRCNGSIPTTQMANTAKLSIVGNTFENCGSQSWNLKYNTLASYNYFQNSTSATIVSLTFSNGTFANNRFHHVNVSTSSINIIQIANNANSFYGNIYGNLARMNRTQIQCMMPIFSLDAGQQCCHIYISNNMLIDDSTGALISPSLQVYATALQPNGCCVKIENQSWYFAGFGNYMDLTLWNCSAEYDWNQYGTLYTEAYNQNTSSGKPWPDSGAANRAVNFSTPFNFRAYGVNHTALPGARVWVNDSIGNPIFSGTTNSNGYLFTNGTHYIRWGSYNATMLHFANNYSIVVNKTAYGEVNESWGWSGTSWSYPDPIDSTATPFNGSGSLNYSQAAGFNAPLKPAGESYTLSGITSFYLGSVYSGIETDYQGYIPNPVLWKFGGMPIEGEGCSLSTWFRSVATYATSPWGAPTLNVPYYTYATLFKQTSTCYFVTANHPYSVAWTDSGLTANRTYPYVSGTGAPIYPQVARNGNGTVSAVTWGYTFGLGVTGRYPGNGTYYTTPGISSGGRLYYSNNLKTSSGTAYDGTMHTVMVDYKPRSNAGNYSGWTKLPIVMAQSSTYDPDNATNTLNFTWLFREGGIIRAYYGSTINKTWNIAGIYRYTLIVADTNGGWDWSNGTITVKKNSGIGNPPPIVPPTPPPFATNDTFANRMVNLIVQNAVWVLIIGMMAALGVTMFLFPGFRKLALIPLLGVVLLIILLFVGILPPIALGGG